MKKAVSLVLALCFCMSIVVTSAFAVTPTQTKEIVPLEDGSYFEVITTVYGGQSTRSIVEQYAEKDYILRNGLGIKQFTYTLKGWFSYNNVVSSCTAVSYSSTIHAGSWGMDSHSETRSGSTAYGDASYSSSTDSRDVSISLRCDKDGNIS